LSDRIPGRVLVCTRRLLDRAFREVASRVFSGEIYCFDDLSLSLESHDVRKSFYHHYRKKHVAAGISADDLNQVVQRDRVLRILPRDQAERMAHAMKLTLEEMLDRVQPNYLFSQSVDCYILDLLFRTCRERKIAIVGIVSAGVNGRCQVTSYGEFNKVCDPNDAEIDLSLTSLVNDEQRIIYSAAYTNYSAARHFSHLATHWGKAIFFKLKSVVENDPLNWRYIDRCKLWPGHRDVFTYRCVRLFDGDWEAKAQSSALPNLFIPLSHTPECSTDYWLNDLRYVDYERFVLDSCRKLSPYYSIFIKEHWSVIGNRRAEFYEKLKEVPGLVLVPAGVNSRLVMQKIDRILVGAGTAGVEGALRGKRVTTLGKAYYDVEGYFLRLRSADEINDLPRLIEAHRPPEATEHGQRTLVRRLLETTFPGDIVLGPQLNTRDNWETLAQSVIKYLSSSYFSHPQTQGNV